MAETPQRAEALLAELRKRHKYVPIDATYALDHLNIIERALLAERERCAKLAEKFPGIEAMKIAAAIRQQPGQEPKG